LYTSFYSPLNALNARARKRRKDDEEEGFSKPASQKDDVRVFSSSAFERDGRETHRFRFDAVRGDSFFVWYTTSVGKFSSR
jgi:hypothetical protein